MTLERYADWLARGRGHQAEGRIIDALLCYRRALREVSGGVDARFHLGEMAWHLGKQAEAIAAWQGAAELAPNHLPSWQALADAFAATGQFESALQAAGRVLHLRPAERRAAKLSALLRAATGQTIDDDALATSVRSKSPWPLHLTAAVIQRVIAGESRGAYAHALPALLDAAASASITETTQDALRGIALVLAHAGDRPGAEAFADRYAQSCHALHRPTMPLLWPLRTAGAAVRVGFLASNERLREAEAFVATHVSDQLAGQCRCTVFVTSNSDESHEPGGLDVRALPPDPEAAARTMAALDLDVLIDLAGLSAPSGPLLARHAARELWAVQREDVPVARRLADRVFAGVPSELVPALVDALHATQVEVAGRPTSSMSAATLAMLWDDAVRSHQRGAAAAAKSGYANVLHSQPNFASALYLTGMVAREENDVDTARERFHCAVHEAPAFVEARAALADLEVFSGNAPAGAVVARQGLEISPGSVDLWRALGLAELKRGDGQAAADAFVEALKRDPTHGETHYNRGVALQMARDSAEAARAYQRALAFRPDLHAADFNLGVIFDQQGNSDAAIAAFSNVLERAPTHAAAYKALAETLLATGRVDAWFANFDRFERHCPNHLALAVHALEVCAYRADFSKLARYLDGLRSERFSEGSPEEVLDALQQLLYLLHFFDVESELIGRHARTHDAMAGRIYGEPRPRNAVRHAGKLRIGYVSGDFRNHVMGKMMWEALRHHDRDRFELFGYMTINGHDEWTDRFQSIFTRFATLGALTDRDAAQRVADDDLDVLVDLSTHTKGARPGILALQPARVQITHVASAGTLAMSAIDFKLTDHYADVDHDPNLQIERPLVMDGCVYPYRHVAPSSTGVFTRERMGIPVRAVLIGAFCTPLKLSQRCLALWREVLLRIPDAMLAFSPVHPALRTVFLRIGATAGIDARRIVFVPQGRDDAENQARYRLLDFVLDPLPYGGVNGTLEALDMRVPVVTMVGRRHAERTSYSILSNLGVTDTIAQSGADYVELAVRLATDPAFMHDVRRRIAAALSGSALTDMPAHTRNLERAYLTALEQCAPESLADAGHDVQRAG